MNFSWAWSSFDRRWLSWTAPPLSSSCVCLATTFSLLATSPSACWKLFDPRVDRIDLRRLLRCSEGIALDGRFLVLILDRRLRHSWRALGSGTNSLFVLPSLSFVRSCRGWCKVARTPLSRWTFLTDRRSETDVFTITFFLLPMPLDVIDTKERVLMNRATKVELLSADSVLRWTVKDMFRG